MNLYSAIQHCINRDGIPNDVREAFRKYLSGELSGIDKGIPADAICCFSNGSGWSAIRRSPASHEAATVGTGPTIEAAAFNLQMRETCIQVAREESANPATEQAIRSAVHSVLTRDDFKRDFASYIRNELLRGGP